MKIIFPLLILICFSSSLLGQQFSGKVIQTKTKEALPFALIYIDELQNGVSADENGTFSFQTSSLTHVNLQISMIGYETQIFHIHLTENTQMTFELSEAHLQLDEVVVSTSLGKLQSDNVAGVNITKMEKLQLNQASSLAGALTAIPGVDQISTGSGIGKPVIRGLSGNRIVVYSQGIRLENQQFGSEHGLGDNAVGISRVELIKGPASLLYGADALGGVLYLVDEPYALQNTIKGFVHSGFNSNDQQLQNSLGFQLNKKIKWNLFSAYNNSMDYKIPDSRHVSQSRFDEMSVKTAIGYNKKNWTGDLKYSYLGNHFGIPEDGQLSKSSSRSPQLPYQFITQHLVSTEHSLFIGQTELNAIIGFIENHRIEYESAEMSTAANDEKVTGIDMILKTFTYNIKEKAQWNHEKTALISGIQGMYQTNRNASDEILIPDATVQDVGVYTVLHHKHSNSLSLESGVRWDRRAIETVAYVNENKSIPSLSKNFHGLNFSLGAVLHKDKITLRTNVSTGFRPPNTSELLSDGRHDGALRYEIGNRTLKNEKAFQADINLAYANAHIQVTLNPFINFINDYIFLQPNGQTIDQFSAYQYTQTNAALYGGECTFHWHPHNIHWLLLETNLSTVMAEDRNGQPLPLIPATRFNNQISAEIGKGKKLNLKSIFIVHVHKFDQNRVGLEESQSVHYSLLNAGISGDLKISTNTIEWKTGVTNLTNLAYIDHLSRLKPDGVYNPGRNIFLSIKWNWSS